MYTEEEKEELKKIKQAAIGFNFDSVFRKKDLIIPSSKIVIAGGWFASLIRNEPARNIDVFILVGPEKENYEKHRYNLKAFLSRSKQAIHENQKTDLPKEMYWEVFEDQKRKPKIRYIFSKSETREELIASFDFVHCTISFDTSTDTLYVSQNAYYAAKNKVLLPNGKNHLSISRMKKFSIEGGYKFGHGCNIISTIDIEKNCDIDPGHDLEIPEKIEDD